MEICSHTFADNGMYFVPEQLLFAYFAPFSIRRKKKKKHQKKCQKQKINVNAKLDRNSFVRPTGTTTTLASEEERIKKVSFGYNGCIFFSRSALGSVDIGFSWKHGPILGCNAAESVI